MSQQKISKLDQELVPGYRNVAYLCDGPVHVGLPQKSVEMFGTWDGHAQSLFVLLYQNLAKNVERSIDMQSGFFRGKQILYQGHLCDSLN